jgi:hypothetical protein
VSPPRCLDREVIDPGPEQLRRDRASLEQDVRFVAALLKVYPSGASLHVLGLREVDQAYREALGALVGEPERRP